MQAKNIMITGANAGIGKAAAAALVRMGHHVIMVCRNKARGEAARTEVAAAGPGTATLLIGDLALQASVRHLVDTFTARHERLDGLIHNAALFDLTQKERRLTDEGFETVWATNYLGPFLLTQLLLDTLLQSAPARILNISSKGLLTLPRLRMALDDPGFEHRRFSMTQAYYQSKLALLTYTYALAQRLADTGVTVNAIRVPAVRLDDDRVAALPWYLRLAYRPKRAFSTPPETLAAVYAQLATAPEWEGINGAYFDEHLHPVSLPNAALDETLQEQLWRLSEQMVE